MCAEITGIHPLSFPSCPSPSLSFALPSKYGVRTVHRESATAYMSSLTGKQ